MPNDLMTVDLKETFLATAKSVTETLSATNLESAGAFEELLSIEQSRTDELNDRSVDDDDKSAKDEQGEDADDDDRDHSDTDRARALEPKIVQDQFPIEILEDTIATITDIDVEPIVAELDLASETEVAVLEQPLSVSSLTEKRDAPNLEPTQKADPAPIVKVADGATQNIGDEANIVAGPKQPLQSAELVSTPDKATIERSAERTSARGYNPFLAPGETTGTQNTNAQTTLNNAAAAQPGDVQPAAQNQSGGDTQQNLSNGFAAQTAAMQTQAGPAGSGQVVFHDFLAASKPGDLAPLSGLTSDPSTIGGLSNSGLSQAGGTEITLKAQTANGRPQLPTTDIAAQISKHVASGKNRFEIRLDPPELGRIDVRLEFGDNGQMSAHLTTDRPETLDLLQRDARALEKALQALGLDAEDGALDFSLRRDRDPENRQDTADSDTGATNPETSEDGDGPSGEPAQLVSLQQINLVV